MGELQQLSLKDLYQYLKTSKSAKYDEEKILGWWQLDPHATFTLARRKNPDMPAKQMAQLKQMLLVWLPQLTVMAAPDKSLLMRVELGDAAKQMIERMNAAAEAAQQASQQAQGGGVQQLPPGYAERYGLMRRGPGATRTQDDGSESPAAPPTPALPGSAFAGKGSWDREGSSLRYKVKFQNEQGQEQSGTATVEQHEMLLTANGQTLVFVRTY
jgi:hypothetical protein